MDWYTNRLWSCENALKAPLPLSSPVFPLWPLREHTASRVLFTLPGPQGPSRPLLLPLLSAKYLPRHPWPCQGKLLCLGPLPGGPYQVRFSEFGLMHLISKRLESSWFIPSRFEFVIACLVLQTDYPCDFTISWIPWLHSVVIVSPRPCLLLWNYTIR